MLYGGLPLRVSPPLWFRPSPNPSTQAGKHSRQQTLSTLNEGEVMAIQIPAPDEVVETSGGAILLIVPVIR